MWSARAARRISGTISIAFLLVATACARASEAPQTTLRDLGGEVAKSQLSLFLPIFWIAVVIFFLVEGALVVAVVKFRQRSDRDVPVQVHGNKALELTWTIIPAVILAVAAVPTVATIFSLAQTPTGPGVLKVEVTARQWWWEYRYPDLGVVTANEMHIPVGHKVAVALRSEDVIHSFWVPRLAGKQDVVPGTVNHLVLQADEPGVYRGQCAEFCALSHANMRLRVIAQSDAEFARWVGDQKADALSPVDPLAVRGKQIFEANQCILCHAIRGTKAIGKLAPDLTHLASRTTFAGATFDFTEQNLIDWVRDAPSMKPSGWDPKEPTTQRFMPRFRGTLSEEDIRAVVAYLMSLR